MVEGYEPSRIVAQGSSRYLLHHGARTGNEPIVIHQGQFTGRPSTIEIRPDPDGRLWVGGPVAPVAGGRFHAQPASVVSKSQLPYCMANRLARLPGQGRP